MLLQEVKPAQMMHYPHYPEIAKSSERMKRDRQPAMIGYGNARYPIVSGFAEKGNLTPTERSHFAKYRAI